MSTLLKTNTYLESYAKGLVIFALSDEKFSVEFKKSLLTLPVDKFEILKVELDFRESDLLFMPNDYYNAIDRLKWLLQEIDNKDKDEATQVLNILNGILYKKQELPIEMIVWGLKYTEKYGPGLGDMIQSSIAFSQVIILNKSCDRLNKYKLLKEIYNASTQVVYMCMQDSSFNFERIEPEVISWLSDSRQLDLFYANSINEFDKIIAQLVEARIKFSKINIDNENQILALQPSYQGVFENITNNLQIINELE